MDGGVLEVLPLGLMDYREALALQERIQRRVLRGEGPFLLLAEHPPTITLGRAAQEGEVLVDGATLRRLGIDLCRTDRGGRTTYHGPGQLLAYPILDLRRLAVGCNLHRYLRLLEQVVIDTLAEFGIVSWREEGLTGVWTASGKIAAIGIAVRRWTTRHGLALNVDCDLDRFGLIIPCGLARRPITSMGRLTARRVEVEEVVEPLVRWTAHHLRLSGVKWSEGRKRW